jgi:hypothetical protein
MNLRTVFTINVPISVFFGIACLAVPRWLMSLYGVELSDGGVAMTQLAGAAYLGFGTLALLARTYPSHDLVIALAFALFVQDLIGTIVSVYWQLDGTFNGFGWTTVAVYGLLAAAYGYFLLPGNRPT